MSNDNHDNGVVLNNMFNTKELYITNTEIDSKFHYLIKYANIIIPFL